MGYHYIVLIGSAANGDPGQFDHAAKHIFQQHGMRPVSGLGLVQLFVSKETPVMRVPGGVVVGHLFERSGEPVREGAFANVAVGRVGAVLLADCWGEYVLIQVGAGSGVDLRVLREPSGGVQCLYSFERATGFITSDVALPTDLGILPRRVDWSYVAQALAYPHVNTIQTGIAGVRELLPGTRLERSGGRLDVREAWCPWTCVSESSRYPDFQSAAAEVRAAVTTVASAWARTDATVLVELSGGLDSSVVAMSLLGTEAQVHCCTMVTPVPGADERSYAAQVARALQVDLQVATLGFGNAGVDFELPVATARPRMTVLQNVAHEAMQGAAARCGARSFFSGGGGDTVFSYLQGAVPAADAFRQRGPRAGLRSILDLSMLHQCTHWRAGRLALRKLLRGRKQPCRADTSLLAPGLVPSPVAHPWFNAPDGVLAGDQERIADLAGTQVFRESAPRSSTHWLRLPLLSQPVVEACLRAPSWMWIEGGRNRAVARSAFADLLPLDVLERRSKGTFMNYFGAIYQRNSPRMRDFLLMGQLEAHGLLDTAALVRFFETPLPPRDTSFIRIFDLCMIENWLRRWDEGS